jgi:hypothetical protein
MWFVWVVVRFYLALSPLPPLLLPTSSLQAGVVLIESIDVRREKLMAKHNGLHTNTTVATLPHH